MSALELEALRVAVGQRTLLGPLSLRVERGDFVALLGTNGAGKTTLLKAALALRAPTAGRVLVGGRSLSELGGRERAAALAWLPQHPRSDEPVTALETVVSARFRFQETHAAARRKAELALARARATSYAERRITELSGGERQRVAFAALIAQEAEILLLDEPANHLDPAQQLDAYRLLGELWREGRTVVCISHDVNLLQHLGAPQRVRVVGLHAGRIAFEAPLSDARLPERLGELFGIELEALKGSTQRFIVPRARSAP